jgi:CheY-like chemotaxis protein
MVQTAIAIDVLVVDDDRKTVDLLRLYLERAGYSVRVAYDGRHALEFARERPPDLVVLDLMLPLLDGLDVCDCLFEEVGRVPVIMLTARTTEADKLAGLEAPTTTSPSRSVRASSSRASGRCCAECQSARCSRLSQRSGR